MTLDAFSGVGWDLGAQTLGLDPIGIDHDAAVCATRGVLGMPTIRADVAALPLDHLAGRVEGLIMSPPCQSFSAAGKRLGLDDVRGLLVFEVLRWAETLRPRWLACEQVPEVLPIWRMFRDRLAELGYSAWCGILDAANYGVPQNRKRAFLLASLDRAVTPPSPTHSRTGAAEMFGEGRERWVSMAEALGWSWLLDPTQAPSWVWACERPATCVQATPRVAPPGYRGGRAAMERQENERQFDESAGAIPVQLWELGVLQGFPSDFPWQGNKTEQARIIGNAVPPPMAAAVLRSVAA